MPQVARPGSLEHAVASHRRIVFAVIIGLIFTATGFGGPAGAQEADLGFSPASGHARVIAQGVASLPEGDAVWRTVRTRAPLPADAPFEERPLGFVLATSGPLLLVAQDSGEQVQLGTGEAAFVRVGTVQQRSSLTKQPVSYLSIELVSVDAAPPAEAATVLQPGQPFAAPAGLHDLDLLSDTLLSGESLTIPDSGAKNVILVTNGAANVGRPGSDPVVLLAGEAASFSGELQVGPAENSSAAQGVSFVVAMIGPEIPPAAIAAATASPEGAEPTAVVADSTAASVGSISVEVFNCPAGMNAETLNAAACAPASGDFDVTLSGAGLAAPLTIGDATPSGDAFIWGELPFGDYVIAEAVLPSGFSSYVLSAQNASGNPNTGYRVSIDAAEPDLQVRIYNFASP